MGLRRGRVPYSLHQSQQQSAALSRVSREPFPLKEENSSQQLPAGVGCVCVGWTVGSLLQGWGWIVDSPVSEPLKSQLRQPDPTLDMSMWALLASGHFLVLECSGNITKG